MITTPYQCVCGVEFGTERDRHAHIIYRNSFINTDLHYAHAPAESVSEPTGENESLLSQPGLPRATARMMARPLAEDRRRYPRRLLPRWPGPRLTLPPGRN